VHRPLIISILLTDLFLKVYLVSLASGVGLQNQRKTAGRKPAEEAVYTVRLTRRNGAQALVDMQINALE